MRDDSTSRSHMATMVTHETSDVATAQTRHRGVFNVSNHRHCERPGSMNLNNVKREISSKIKIRQSF